MDKSFLMGSSDGLARKSPCDSLDTHISEHLKVKLISKAIREAVKHYVEFFNKSPADKIDIGVLTEEYMHVLSRATSYGLFRHGGISEKYHLNLWCLAKVLAPEVYIESGVYIGSSLHAFLEITELSIVYAIDPSLEQLQIPKEMLKKVHLVDDKDFSQLDINLSGKEALVFFDDHINTASRIIQASKKGVRYALFDDSTGMEGICQRLYPATPTLPMILNYELFDVGDEISWCLAGDDASHKEGSTRITLTITDEMLGKCQEAKSVIKKHDRLIDLGEYIPQIFPKRTNDTSKYLVELKCD